MKYYWFAIKVFDPLVDPEPGAPVLSSPYKTYDEAKIGKKRIRGTDIQRSGIFEAKDKEEAEKIANSENYMVGG